MHIRKWVQNCQSFKVLSSNWMYPPFLPDLCQQLLFSTTRIGLITDYFTLKWLWCWRLCVLQLPGWAECGWRVCSGISGSVPEADQTNTLEGLPGSPWRPSLHWELDHQGNCLGMKYVCKLKGENAITFVYFFDQEIANLLALEEATLSTDLQQGYALKSLTGTVISSLFTVIQQNKMGHLWNCWI